VVKAAITTNILRLLNKSNERFVTSKVGEMTKRETSSIRIDSNVKAALDMIAAERQLITGKNTTVSDAIWYLIENGAKHIADRVNELATQSEADEKRASD
jgi:hypothetical protein